MGYTTMDVQREVLVLGIGNLLWADEGFGVRAVEALNQAFRFPAGVELMDGGTLGLSLLPYIETSRRVLVELSASWLYLAYFRRVGQRILQRVGMAYDHCRQLPTDPNGCVPALARNS